MKYLKVGYHWSDVAKISIYRFGPCDSHHPIPPHLEVKEWKKLKTPQANLKIDNSPKMPREVTDIKSFIEICRRKDASCTFRTRERSWNVKRRPLVDGAWYKANKTHAQRRG